MGNKFFRPVSLVPILYYRYSFSRNTQKKGDSNWCTRGKRPALKTGLLPSSLSRLVDKLKEEEDGGDDIESFMSVQDNAEQEEDCLHAIYVHLRGTFTQIRRSIMTHDMLHTIETLQDRMGRDVVNEILWMASNNLYMQIIRFNIQSGVFSGPSAVVYDSRLAGIPMCGVHKAVIMAVCDLVWIEFSRNLDIYPIYDEEGGKITEPVVLQEQQQTPYSPDMVKVQANDTETVISLEEEYDSFVPTTAYVHTPAPPPLPPKPPTTTKEWFGSLMTPVKEKGKSE